MDFFNAAYKGNSFFILKFFQRHHHHQQHQKQVVVVLQKMKIGNRQTLSHAT